MQPAMDRATFTQHKLIRGGHAQTIAGTYLWRAGPYLAKRHSVELGDGDQIVLHDDCPDDWQDSGTIAILVHGLAGCHGSGYMRRISEKLVASGARSFRMDQRGCGAGSGLATRANNGARSEDIGAAVDYLRRKFPHACITIAGFSLGAAMTLKLAGVRGHLLNADRVLAVAPPLDFTKCSANMERGLNLSYSRYFAKLLVQHVMDNSILQSQLSDSVKTNLPRTLADFDRRVTAPLGGFRDVSEYYENASPLQELADISVPTMIITAQDDPLIPIDEFETARFSPTTTVMMPKHGGHLGFLADRKKTDDPDWHWMDWRVVDFVTRCEAIAALH